MATHVLDECHHRDPAKAMMIAERKSPSWSEMSCLQVAASAEDQKFLSSATCYNSMNVIWKHGILFSMPKVCHTYEMLFWMTKFCHPKGKQIYIFCKFDVFILCSM